MILKEFIEDVNIEEIKKYLLTLYSDKKGNVDFDNCQELFLKLKEAPVQHPENHMTLHVELTEDFGNEDYIWTVTYSLYRRYKKKYALEFISLEEIANSYIQEEDVKSREEFIAHILWELLYNQDSEDEDIEFIAEEKKRREMQDTEYYSIADILNSIDDEVYDD